MARQHRKSHRERYSFHSLILESPIETTSEVADKYNLDPKCVERISELTERLDIILDGIEPEPIILDYLENPVEPRLTKRNKKRAVL